MTIRRSPFATIALAITLPFVSSIALADDDAAETTRLASGVAQKSNWEPPSMGERYGHAEVLVHAPIGVVHKAVVDYGRYKELVPDRFHNVHVVGKEQGGTDVYMQVPIMHGMVNLWQVMRFRDVKPTAQGWAIVEGWFVKGNLKNGNAAWTLRAVDESWTVLKFDLLLQLNMPAPQAAIDEELRDAAEQAVNGIRDRAQGQAGPVAYKPR